ncbi:hypothetical protein SO694_00078197 [Aureococcus anophagefferens]|uniref:Reverse transcriptase domain-containing protein n=1 Tax=Aureococcus anophagefferens TaxID=44056 RepID=A0ABR1FH66_AURAN
MLLPNEHLTLVTQRGYPGNIKATATMALVNRFESDRVNAKLPAWLYWIDAAVRLLALVKKLGVGTAAPDASGPSASAASRRRGPTTLVVKIISVGVPSGAHALVFGVRAMTEKKPDFVYAKIDKRRPYNQVHRASIMDALNSDPGLAAYARFRHAYYSRDAPIVIDGRIADFASCEGVQQGDPASCADYAFATHACAVTLDAELQAAGGFARFQVDDGIAAGPADVVFPALAGTRAAAEPHGETIRFDKCSAWSPSLGAALAVHPAYIADCESVAGLTRAQDRAQQFAVVHDGGILVSGVPMGEPEYAESNLTSKLEDTMSYVNKVTTQLRSSSSQALWLLLLWCMSTRVDYWAQTLYVSAPRIFLADFDTAVTSAASDAFGEAGPLILADDLARKRLRMPIRHGGGGLRLSASASRRRRAFFGAGCAVLPTMVDRLMLAAWDSMVAAVAEEEDHEGLLAKPFADAGVGDGGVRVPKMQHRLTAELDKVAFAAYKAELADLAIDGFPYCAAEAARDQAARAWLTTLPVGCAAFTNGEFAEVAATYFGVKSPCMIPHVARRIQNTSSVVDAFGHVFFTDVRILNRKSVRTAWHDSVATLAGVKTIGFAKSRYGRSPARRGGTLPCDERAGIINREYRLHAEKLDKNAASDPSAPSSGFAAGYFGELSKGAHEVLAMAAEEIAERTWVEAGATSLDHAKSIQKQRLYREWGVASVAVARIKIEGLGLIGAPSSIPRPDYGRDAAAKQGPRRGLRPRGPRHRRDLRRRLRAAAPPYVVAPSSSPCSRAPP